MRKIVLFSGGYDPVHSGHISCMTHAKQLGDSLIVGVNSDSWLTRKKGQAFMSWDERAAVVQALAVVDRVIQFDDSDDTAIDAIIKVRALYPSDRILFVNGGDRTADTIPEMVVNDDNLEFIFGVGGTDKKNSSSVILQDWKSAKVNRDWGFYRVLHCAPGIKVKELTVNPKQSLSMQRHKCRAEYWLVQEGTAVVNSQTDSGYELPSIRLDKHQEYHVLHNAWHQLTNPTDVPLTLVEIQYGELCIEEDIERKNK